MGRDPRCHWIWLCRVAICSIGLLGLLVTGTTPATACSDLDFGDAPGFDYPTLLADDGARHEIHSYLFLGQVIDSEHDGQPTVDATGDNLDGIDDDDGIVFTSLLIAGHQVTLEADVFGAGLLNAWIDFNIDGDWDDVGEQIFADEAMTDGLNSLAFDVPAYAALGQTFARFRLASAGGLTPIGLAWDGEVEDYATSISSVPEPGAFSMLSLGLLGLVVYGKR
jgi:hypothetical protein